jgi:murein hydrolase activator
MRPAFRAVAATLVASCTARAGALEHEKADVESRLAAERLTLAALKDRKTSVLGVVDLLQRMSHDAKRRERLARAELSGLKRQLEVAALEERLTAQVYSALAARLAPRLRAMYRLTRRSALDVLLSASDFASMIWRSRAMATVLDGDLELLRQTHEVLAYERAAHERMEVMRASYGERLLALEQQGAFAARENAELGDMVSALQADSSQRSRLVRELEGEGRHLESMIEQMAKSADSAFGRLKGHLPYPCAGLVEIGFGRIVNPRFNTVTVQKGLDIRASEGAPVRAVAAGKVVYASWLRGYGNILILDHGSGFHTLMGHLNDFARQVGDDVNPGDALGTVGDTGSLKGAYLYFELRQNGQAVDPSEWLSEAAER